MVMVGDTNLRGQSEWARKALSHHELLETSCRKMSNLSLSSHDENLKEALVMLEDGTRGIKELLSSMLATEFYTKS